MTPLRQSITWPPLSPDPRWQCDARVQGTAIKQCTLNNPNYAPPTAKPNVMPLC